MGIGIVFLFWSAIGAVLLTVFICLSLLGRRHRAAGQVRNVLLAVVAAIAIPFALLVAVGYARDFLPSHVFSSSFGFDPPTDVVELSGRRFRFGDGGDAYLRFRASKATVDRIMASGFSEVEGPEMGCHNFFGSDPIPTAWQVPTGPRVRCFRYSFSGSAGASRASLLFEEQTGTVFYYWTGID